MPKKSHEIKQFNQGTILNASERDISDSTAAFSLNINPVSEDGILDSIPNDRLAVAVDDNVINVHGAASWSSNNLGTENVLFDNIIPFKEKSIAKLYFIGNKGKKEALQAINIKPLFEYIWATEPMATPAYAEETEAASTSSVTLNVDDGSSGDVWHTHSGHGDALTKFFVDQYIYKSDGTLFGKCTARADTSNANTLTFSSGLRAQITDNDILYRRVIASYTPASTISVNANELPYLTSTNAITSDGSGVSGTWGDSFGATGITSGTGTITITLDTDTVTTKNNLGGGKFTLITPSGYSVEYLFNKLYTTTFSGYISGSNTAIGISDISSVNDIAEAVKEAINHPNGHGGRIQATRDGAVVSLSYNEPLINKLLNEDDYFKLGTSNEIIKVVRDDEVNSQLIIKRGCFDTVKSRYVTTSNYDIQANRETIGLIQRPSYKAFALIDNWSKYSGNHIGANSHYLVNSSTARYNGAIDTSSSSRTITFSSTNKTITCANVTGMNFFEGDILNVYYGADGEDEPNNGKSFKILKKVEDSGNTIFTVDTAPTDDTESADTVYFECNLLKNHTFSHASDETNPTVEVHSNQNYKCNNWIHKEYSYTDGAGGDPGTIVNNYRNSTNTTVALQTSGGGYWNDYFRQEKAAQQRYPFIANDVYITLESEFKEATIRIGGTYDIAATDKFLNYTDSYTIFAKGDILKVSSEYMRVDEVASTGIYVTRGLFGTTPAAYTSTTVIYKCINTGISQSVSKDNLKTGQPYILSFYAKDEYISSTYGSGYLSITFNGGYIDKDGNWNESISDWKTQGKQSTSSKAMQEQRWIPFSDLNAPEGGTNNPDGLDVNWKKFDIIIYPGKKIPFATDMEIEFASRGQDGTKISLDLTSLNQYNPIGINNEDVQFKSVGKIDNKGSKDLVIYDYENQEIKHVKDFKENELRLQNATTDIELSSRASNELKSDNNEAAITSRNREVHIGFGSKKSSSSPQWMGYLNHECFGKDYSQTLYQDEDTVHSYDDIGIMSMSKVCLAGEHEYLSAYWNHDSSTAPDDGESGTLSLNAKTMRIYHSDHKMKTGDNIVVRQYADTANEWDGSGVWVVTAGDGLAYFECKRYTAKDAEPATTGGATAKFKVSYRPYFYYGMRNDDYFLYRIFPDDLIKSDLSGVDASYPAGTIQKSLPLGYNILSITCCHNKIHNGTTGGDSTGGTGGGMIYALTSSNVNEVKVLDVQMKYSEWESLPFTEQSTLTLRFKSYKWSNDHLNGNINGDTAVFDSLASESTPTISYSGILSDIIETKGPTPDYVHAANAASDNPPDHFDTRLWVQTRPSLDDGFSGGDRFLFCGRTEGAAAGTGIYKTSDVYLGDRTPPTITLRPEGFRWDGSKWQFSCGPGADNQLFDSQHAAGSKKKLDEIKAHTYKDDKENYSVVSEANPPVINYGENVGWQQGTDNVCSIQVARYGMFPIADNDGDGVLDGTGVVVPSTTSLPTTTNNKKHGPWGTYHERVTGHAVGLLGGSETNWIRNWGAHDGCNHKITSGDRYYQGAKARAPEDMETSKCIFICSDIHFGDRMPELETASNNYSRHHITPTGAVVDPGSGTGTKFTVASGIVDNLQEGDAIFIHSKGSNTNDIDFSDDRNRSGYITQIIDSTNFVVNVEFHSDFNTNTILFPGSPAMFHYSTSLSSNGNQSTENHFAGSMNTDHPEWAFNIDDKGDADIFKGDSGAYYSKTWFTAPSSKGLSPTEKQEWDTQYVGSGSNYSHGEYSKYMYPGKIFKVDRLNYRAGYMIRPLDMDENTFQDLVVGLGTTIEMPSKPDVVYHKKDSSNRLDYHLDNTEVNNEFASRIYISSPVPDTYSQTNKSKLYIIDPKFQFPNMTNQIVIPRTTGHDTNTWNDTWKSYEPYIYGKLEDDGGDNSGPYKNTAATTVDVTRYADRNPCVIINGTDTGFTDNNGLLDTPADPADNLWTDDGKFTGMMMTILDKDTGTMQTRYIVGSSYNSNRFYFALHYPLGHRPVIGDHFWIWDHSYACTATMRLYRETDLILSEANNDVSMKALKGDPTLEFPIYKDNGEDDGTAYVDRSSSTVTFNCLQGHNLTTNDKIEVHGASEDALEGVYKVTVTDPKVFTYTTSTSGTINNATAKWRLSDTSNSEASVSNPILVNFKAPLVKTMFGGLDMRKLKTASITAIADNSDDITLTASANHLFDVGDTITFNSTTADQDGIYNIKADNGSTTFDITNTDHTDDSGTWPVTTNQWEHFIMATGGTGYASEVRSGFNSWDRGLSTANLFRNDNDTATNAQLYLNDTESAVKITPTSLGNEDGDYFVKNNNYEYKVSLIYDGYQEGPLSSSTWTFIDTTATRNKLLVEVTLKNFSKRLTHVCLYRRNNSDSFYRLVSQMTTATGWSFDGDTYRRNVIDTGNTSGSYEARTGRSEILDTIKVKYGMATEIDGYLFVGNCSHEKIKDASNQIFRSRPGQYSIFDYSVDFIQLKSKPTAMANFAGRLYVFDENNLYKVNQQSLAIEDTFEGIGCSGPNSILVTEFGMFFADKNGAYMHNGTSPSKISNVIETGGGTDNVWGGTDNIKDLSWDSVGRSSLAEPALVTYDSSTNSALFILKYVDYDATLETSVPKYYAWAYNLLLKRWDLWELCEDSVVGTPFIGDKGGIFIPIDNCIYEYKGGSSKRDYTWLSKKLTMQEDSIVKVFNKIKINGITSDLNLGGDYKESSDRLLLKTSIGDIASSDMTYSSPSATHSEYKIKSTNKKGRWLQFKLEDMTEPIDSIGLILRRKATK